MAQQLQRDTNTVPTGAAPPPGAQRGGFLSVSNLVKRFGSHTALSDVSLDIRAGELVCLLGPSGCGKTTLLRAIAGLERQDSGTILLSGRDISHAEPQERDYGILFQSYALFPNLTVAQNVAYGLSGKRAHRKHVADRVEEMLTLVGLAGASHKYPGQISGGQQQRVALARALAPSPSLLLLDEPMSALDKQIRQKTQIELVKILEQVGVTCIMVTHDQEEAMTMAHRLAVMTEGQIVQCGTPQDVYAFPNSRFVASFIGSTNMFTGTIVVDEPDHVAIESPELSRPLYVSHGVSEPLGMDVHVSIRPERMVVSRTQPDGDYNWAHGMVSHMAWMGSYALYQIRLDSGAMVEASVPSLQLAQLDAPGIDEEIFVSWDADSATVLAS